MQFISKSVINKTSVSNSKFTKRFFNCGLSISIFTLLLSSSFIPKTANAGFFSLISNIGGDSVSAKSIDGTNKTNTQNMPILEAAVSSDLNTGKSDNSSILAYGNALSAEIGPQGTVTDVENKVSGEISIYTVHEGDTLLKVAQMFDVSINTIVWANELTRNSVLKEGQTLVILPISGIKYTIKKGDTIKGIVYQYKANLEEVLQYNDLTVSSVLVPGRTIIIPDAEPTIPSTPKIAQKRTISKTNTAHDTNGPFYPGYYVRPVDTGLKSQGLHGYNAVDLAAPVGTPIHASAAGTVIASISNGGWNGGYGNFVIISHDNGTQTLYAHTLKNYVNVGEKVTQGEMIAKIGMTGKTTGPHVHFEIRGAKNPF